jgi:hypothetical protein
MVILSTVGFGLSFGGSAARQIGRANNEYKMQTSVFFMDNFAS